MGKEINAEQDLAKKQKLQKRRDELQSDLDEGRLGVVIETPFLSNIVRSFEASNTYEAVSGGTDLASWIGLDPLNFAAAGGVGFKFAKTIPRANNLSKGRAMLQQLVPFWGGRVPGVRGGATTRITWAAFSRTVDEGIALIRVSKEGHKIYNTFRSAEGAEELVRKIKGLPAPMAEQFIKIAKTNDEDFFWEAYRSVMHGWNEAGDPASFVALTNWSTPSPRPVLHSAVHTASVSATGSRRQVLARTPVRD